MSCHLNHQAKFITDNNEIFFFFLFFKENNFDVSCDQMIHMKDQDLFSVKKKKKKKRMSSATKLLGALRVKLCLPLNKQHAKLK